MLYVKSLVRILQDHLALLAGEFDYEDNFLIKPNSYSVYYKYYVELFLSKSTPLVFTEDVVIDENSMEGHILNRSFLPTSRILFEIFLFKGKVLLGPFVLGREFHYLMAYKIKLR